MDKETKQLQRELKQRLSMESKTKRNLLAFQKKQNLMKQVKALRFQQSPLGRTISTGKGIFQRIGEVTGKIGGGMGGNTAQKGKVLPRGSKAQKPMTQKPFDLSDTINRLPA